MTYNDNDSTVTISRARYAELVVAEQDAKRFKDIVDLKRKQFSSFTFEEIKLLNDLFPIKEEEK